MINTISTQSYKYLLGCKIHVTISKLYRNWQEEEEMILRNLGLQWIVGNGQNLYGEHANLQKLIMKAELSGQNLLVDRNIVQTWYCVKQNVFQALTNMKAVWSVKYKLVKPSFTRNTWKKRQLGKSRALYKQKTSYFSWKHAKWLHFSFSKICTIT